MSTSEVTLAKVLASTKSLSTKDKIKLIQEVTGQIAHELAKKSLQPRKSLRGLWRGLRLSEEEIDNVRKEIWQDFPRKNIE